MNGLDKIKKLLEEATKETVIRTNTLSELAEDLEVIKSILNYHAIHKSLDETAASIKSLSILKAAAIYEIVEREKSRDNNSPYRLRMINEEICWIAEYLRREGPFLEVRPPDWLIDYVAV